ncbi:MAG: sensor histidine kinase [Verrucomicrobiota bacterium]
MRFLIFFVLPCLLAAEARARTGAVLTDIGEIRALNRGQVVAHLPARITGTVVMRTRDGAFVDDGKGVLWCNFPRIPEEARDGMIVEFEGKTNQTGFSPWLGVERYRIVGEGVVPAARKVPMERLLSGAEDCRRIELEGVVQEAVPARGEFIPLLVLKVGGQICRVKVREKIDVSKLVDARIRVRGVFQPQVNLRGQPVGLELFAPSAGIEVLREPPADPFRSLHLPLADLMAFSHAEDAGHRRVISGIVTFVYPGFFFLRDGDVSVRIDGGTAGVRVGDEADVAGFVTLDHTLAGLRGAVIRKKGSAIPPPAADVTPAEILRPKMIDEWSGIAAKDQSGMVVRLRGRLLRLVQNADPVSRTLLIESSGEVFSAYIPAGAVKPNQWLPGSVIRITGACELEFQSSPVDQNSITHAIDGFHIWLSSADAVEILSKPSWLTPRRMGLLLAGVAGLLLLVMVWNLILRREVAKRGARLAREISLAREERLEFDATIRERSRVAGDLHDNLQQTLAGLSLQLEAADHFHAEDAGRSGQHLTLARKFLERVRGDFHRTVWNLRMFTRDVGSLEKLLCERMATAEGADRTTVEIKTVGTPVALPDFIAGNILMLVEEAVTNAVSHSHGSRVEVVVSYAEEEISVTVTDDGRGFDPATAPGQESGHFGLQGMRERAKRIGGKVDWETPPGGGTRVTLLLPGAACLSRPAAGKDGI